MDFVVLARKLRPARFEHLIGQETVVRALRNAIRTDRVAHAFLFAGSRGVGKTSTARILTKALNCEQPQDGEPCNACSNCHEITLNTSPDVYEIDAASNRGIDNIRELRENTKYSPVKSRFKTYIIDEAHMLTTESFNALLKTLEEPPPHVKFVLATTNPHKIPETILSRCQRYDFPRIPLAVLTDYLVQVTAHEGIRFSRPALEAIARNAAGGVRDALTAVDQVVSYAGVEADDAQVLSILGLTDNREVSTLLGAILGQDLPGALESFAAIREHGHDLGVLLEALIGEVKDFSLYLSLEGQGPTFAEHPPDTLAFFAEQRARVTLDELQQLFYLLLEVEEQIKRSEFAQACFEMGLVKACRVQPLVGIAELLAEVRALGPGTGAGAGAPAGPSAAGAPAPARPGAPPAGSSRAAAHAATQSVAPAPVVATTPAAPTVPAVPPPRPAPGVTGAAGAGPRAAAGDPGATGFDAFSARAKARSRESGSRGAAPSTAQGDRGASADEGDEAEPGRSPEAQPTPAPSRPNGSAPPPVEPDTVPEAVSVAPLAPPPQPVDTVAAAAAAAADLPVEPDAPRDEGPALCDDPRWRGAVEAIGGKHPRLASKLRRAEVQAIEPDAVRLLPGDAANALDAGELETARSFARAAFGDAFHIVLADDTKEKARDAHTIAGRNRIEAAAHLAARRAAAEGDEQVQRLLRAFPKARVVEIALSDEPRDPPHPNRSEDV